MQQTHGYEYKAFILIYIFINIILQKLKNIYTEVSKIRELW